MQDQFFILFIIVGGAAAVPFIARRIDVPSAVLEILYGFFLFNTLLSSQPDWFHLLKEIGFVYLMFIAGMELDVWQLIRGGRFPWYVLISVLSFVSMPLIFVALGYSFYLGVAVSVLSAGIIIPVLKEVQLLRTDFGRDLIGIALTGELLSIAFLTGIDIYHSHGMTVTAALAGAKLLLLLLLAALFLKILYVIAWWNPERVAKVMESEDPVEEGIRAVITIAFAGGLMAIAAGVEPILGSFMAGVIFSMVFRSKGRLEEKINAVGFGFFTPFFFIGVGADLHVRQLTSLPVLGFSLFLVFMIYLSNVFPVLLSRFMKLTLRESLGVSLLLSAPLSLIVVSGTLGEKMGIITDEMKISLIIAALISGIVYPFLFRRLVKTGTFSPPADGRSS